MAYEDLYCFKIADNYYAFHIKTTFCVQVDFATFRLIESKGLEDAFLKEFSMKELIECKSALDSLYESDLIPKEVDLSNKLLPGMSMVVIDCSFMLKGKDAGVAFSSLLNKFMCHAKHLTSPMKLVLFNKGKYIPCGISELVDTNTSLFISMPLEDNVFLVTKNSISHSIRSFPDNSVLIYAKNCINLNEIYSYYERGVRSIYFDWFGFIIGNQGLAQLNELYDLLALIWQKDPTFRLDPISVWIEAIYSASYPRYTPCYIYIKPDDSSSCAVFNSIYSDKGKYLSPSLLENLLGNISFESMPRCRACPILHLCNGGHWVDRVKLTNKAILINQPDLRECAVAFKMLEISVRLYNFLEENSLLEVQAVGQKKQEEELFLENDDFCIKFLGSHDLSVMIPFLDILEEDYFFSFDKFQNLSSYELRSIIEDNQTKRAIAFYLNKSSLMGFAWLVLCVEDRRADMSIYLIEDGFWNTDKAERYLNGILERVIDNFTLHKLSLHVNPKHFLLENLCKKAGLIFEGIQKEIYLSRGKYKDILTYSKI